MESTGVEYVYTSTSLNVLDLTMLSEGSHTAQLRVRDKVGNVRWWNHTFVHDVTALKWMTLLLTTTNNGWLVSSGVRLCCFRCVGYLPSARLFVNGAELPRRWSRRTADGGNEHGSFVRDGSRRFGHQCFARGVCGCSYPDMHPDLETGSEMWYNTSLLLATVQSGPSNVTSQLHQRRRWVTDSIVV